MNMRAKKSEISLKKIWGYFLRNFKFFNLAKVLLENLMFKMPFDLKKFPTFLKWS